MQIGFANRVEAGRQLSRLLVRYSRQEAIILTPMNGSIILGKVVSEALGIPLDVMIVATLHHPIHWDKCIGAISPDDHYLSPVFSGYDPYIKEIAPRLRKRLSEQAELFKRGRLCLSLKGKTVIISTEGCRTGSKLIASLRLIGKLQPARIVVAAPVMAAAARRVIEEEGYEVRCLYTPMPYTETRSFYRDFGVYSDEGLAEVFWGGCP
jgi:putative phosphoribosyl transferase